MADFQKAFDRTIGYEGGYGFDPRDTGGETNWGITKRDYPHLDIKALTKAEAEEIYRRDYWGRLRLDALVDDDVAAEIFDTGVNCGLQTASRIAQRACNALGSHLIVDGYLGPLSFAAIELATQKCKTTLLVVLNCLQAARYVELTEKNETLKIFLKGWINNRVQLVQKTDVVEGKATT